MRRFTFVVTLTWGYDTRRLNLATTDNLQGVLGRFRPWAALLLVLPASAQVPLGELDDALPGINATYETGVLDPVDWGRTRATAVIGPWNVAGGEAVGTSGARVVYRSTPKANPPDPGGADDVLMPDPEGWVARFVFAYTGTPHTVCGLEGNYELQFLGPNAIGSGNFQVRLRDHSPPELTAAMPLAAGVPHEYVVRYKGSNSGNLLDVWLDGARVVNDFDLDDHVSKSGPFQFSQVQIGGGVTTVSELAVDEFILAPYAPPALEILVDPGYTLSDPFPGDIDFFVHPVTRQSHISWFSGGMRSWVTENTPALLPPNWAAIPGTTVDTVVSQMVEVIDTTTPPTNSAFAGYYRVRTDGAAGYHAALFNGEPTLAAAFGAAVEYFQVPEMGLEGYKSADAAVLLTLDATSATIEARVDAGSVVFLLEGAVVLGTAGDRFSWNAAPGSHRAFTLGEGGLSVGAYDGTTSQVSLGDLFVTQDEPGNRSFTVTGISHTALEVIQYEGSGTVSNYHNTFTTLPGAAIGLRQSGTALSTLQVQSAPTSGVPWTMDRFSAAFAPDDVVQLGAIGTGPEAYAWLHVVEAPGGMELTVDNLAISCAGGTAMKVRETPRGFDSAFFDVIEGEVDVAASDGTVFTLLQDAAAAIDHTTPTTTRATVATHSWGAVDYNGGAGSGTLQRGELIFASAGSYIGPTMANQAELDAVGADPFDVRYDTFDAGVPADWTVHNGSWSASTGEYRQTGNPLMVNRSTVNFPLRRGRFRFEARVTAVNAWAVSPFGSFGSLFKYQDGDNYGQVRWGSYKAGEIAARQGGQGIYELRMGFFKAEVGETHTNEVHIDNGMTAIGLDGVIRAVVNDSFPLVSDEPGFVTESPCAFDDMFMVRYD